LHLNGNCLDHRRSRYCFDRINQPSPWRKHKPRPSSTSLPRALGQRLHQRCRVLFLFLFDLTCNKVGGASLYEHQTLTPSFVSAALLRVLLPLFPRYPPLRSRMAIVATFLQVILVAATSTTLLLKASRLNAPTVSPALLVLNGFQLSEHLPKRTLLGLRQLHHRPLQLQPLDFHRTFLPHST
jgi:hypothetical protein